MTIEYARLLLEKDLASAIAAVSGVVGDKVGWTIDITNNQFSALVIFTYNVGAVAFADSSLSDYLNTLKVGTPPLSSEVEKQMRRWVRVKGVINEGLVKRREKEIVLWNTPDTPTGIATVAQHAI